MFSCEIISPTKKEIFQDVKSITLPAWQGEAQVLSGHAESFMALRDGEVILQLANGEKKNIQIKKAGFYIKDNKAIIIL